MDFGAPDHKKRLRTVKVGVVQPNIPLEVDWDQARKPWIVEHLLQLTASLKVKNLTSLYGRNIPAGRF